MTKEVIHTISFEPISERPTSKSYYEPSVNLVRIDVIGTFWRATASKLNRPEIFYNFWLKLHEEHFLQIINVDKTYLFSDGPTGEPSVVPTTSSKHTGEIVVLLCNNPDDDGNPDCDVYTWDRVEGNDRNHSPTSKTLEFIMDESRAGNYTCTCGNAFGTSDVSVKAEVIFLRGPQLCLTIDHV